MLRTRWLSACVIMGAGALVLAGCSSTSSSSDVSASPSPSDPGKCLLGSWTVDPGQFASSADDTIDATVGGTIDGDIGLGFADSQVATTFNAVYRTKQPGGNASVGELSVEMRGGATATYSAGVATLLLSGGNSGIVLTATSTKDGVTNTIKDVRPYRPLINFSSGTVAYTCKGTSLLLTNQNGMVLTAIRKG